MEFLRNDETLDDLQLKGIHVIQKKDAFRFGVDAVLLANFAKVSKQAKIVDLCSGTGIIPFILAGKTYASDIIGVELQEELVDMANRSAEYNKLQHKIKFICGDLKNIEIIKGIPKVDIVTVNPPYKLYNSGLINLNDKNAISRHEICCTLEDVIIACRILLKDSGRVYMVHRPDRLVDILCTMRKHRIEPKRIRLVHPSVNKAPNIVLIEGQRDGGTFLKWEKPLYVHSEDGGYTQDIIDMYKSDTI